MTRIVKKLSWNDIGRDGVAPLSWARRTLRDSDSSSYYDLKWETEFLPLLVLTLQGRSTGKNQYW